MSTSSNFRAQSAAQRRALFIDADPEIRAMLTDILDPLVWNVRHAPDNNTALTLAGVTHFDLILTSEKTTAKEDVELLRRIRNRSPHTRLIILADESTPIDVIAAMRAHAFSYFSRPFSLGSLVDMVTSAAEEPCWDDGIEVKSATPEWIRLLARCDMKTADRLIQFIAKLFHLLLKQLDLILPDESQSRFRVRQRNRLPIGHRAVPDGIDSGELGMTGVEELLASGKELAFRIERAGRLRLLFGGKGLACTKPGKT